MSVVWASQTEAAPLRERRGGQTGNWSVRRLLLALLLIACLLTLASSAAGRVWHETRATAAAQLAVAPGDPAAYRGAPRGGLQPTVADGMGVRWSALAATAQLQ